MKTGWARIYRQIDENPLWLSEKFTRGQAWIDLVIFANHKSNFFYVRGNKVSVKRGQIAWSEVTMSKRWQWSRNKVRGFLNLLEKEQQIEQQKSSVTSIITILNYDKYQTKGQQTEQQTKQQKDSRRNTNKNVKNVKNVKNKNTGEVIEFFNKAFKTRYTVTDGRTKKLSSRLKVYDLDQIKQAITSISQSPFHTGGNDRGWKADPDFILRNDETIDKWLNVEPVKKEKKKIFIKLEGEHDK